VCDRLHIYLTSQEQRLAIKETFGRLRRRPTYEDCASHTVIPSQNASQLRRNSVAEQGDGMALFAAILRQNTLQQYVICTLSEIPTVRACSPKKGRGKISFQAVGLTRAGCAHWLLYANEAGASWQELTLSTATEKLSGVVNDKETSEYQGTVIPRNGNAWAYRCQRYFVALPIYALLMELWIECVGHFASIIELRSIIGKHQQGFDLSQF
jgi:hypothetical protein